MIQSRVREKRGYLLYETYPELFKFKNITLGVLVFLIFTLVICGRYRREQPLEQELVLTLAPSVPIVEKEQLRLTTPTVSTVKGTEQRSAASPTPTITIKETEQQSSQSSTVSTVKEQQLPSPTPTISIAEINQFSKLIREKIIHM